MPSYYDQFILKKFLYIYFLFIFCIKMDTIIYKRAFSTRKKKFEHSKKEKLALLRWAK